MNKRPHENGGDRLVTKKQRSDTNPSSDSKPSAALSPDELIKQKRAEIQAKMAALTGKIPAPLSVPTAKPLPVSVPPKPSVAPPINREMSERIEEAKRKIAVINKNKGVVEDNPYLAVALASKKKTAIAEPAPQGAGLKMAAHPLLLDTSVPAPQSKKDKYKPMQPKFASIRANIRNTPISTPPPSVPSPIPAAEVKSNPYAAKDAASGSFEGAAPKERTSRGFRFIQKGKYKQIADQVRQEAKLEELKQRIAESARKAGLDSELVEKNIRREAPPEAEWWDVPLLPSKAYADLDQGLAALNIRNDSSPITIYVQHPIPIPAPGDKDAVALKPVMLTKSEQKKMRKQRRQAELQDKRDRVRMGLIPPDAPKVRLANLMKVLTSDAVQDPTRVEARVRREVAMRKHGHEKMNAGRKLTDEQRREKKEAKKLEEERRGLVGAVYRVRTLADPAHQFKVRKNAEQNNLTGVCIYHPSFSMVYVEGAAKLMTKYEKLMTRRINWTEAAPARGEEEVELDGGSQDGGEGGVAGSGAATSSKAAAPGEDGEYGTASLQDNRCDLVWKGDVRERLFKSFRTKVCPTDAAAKEVLGPKMAGFWDTTKNWKPEEYELF